MQENKDHKYFRIWTLFTQWILGYFYFCCLSLGLFSYFEVTSFSFFFMMGIVLSFSIVTFNNTLCRLLVTDTVTAWKMSKYGVFSGPYFFVFSPNTGKYGSGKIPYFHIFYAVVCYLVLLRDVFRTLSNIYDGVLLRK